MRIYWRKADGQKQFQKKILGQIFDTFLENFWLGITYVSKLNVYLVLIRRENSVLTIRIVLKDVV